MSVDAQAEKRVDQIEGQVDLAAVDNPPKTQKEIVIVTTTPRIGEATERASPLLYGWRLYTVQFRYAFLMVGLEMYGS